MITWLVRFCGRHAIGVVFVTFILSVATVASLSRLSLDALPDLSDTQVIVFAEWSGRAPDIVENQVTYPLVTRLLSTPDVKYVRGISMSGATQIVVVFNDGTDLYWARARVTEKLAGVSGLPVGVVPQVGPEATGLGWVFQYALVSRDGKTDLAQLRSLQDWNLRFALQSVAGVAEVAAIGGFVKEYQVHLDPLRLQAFAVSTLDVVRAIRAGNQEIGAGSLELGGTELLVRGRGYINTIDEIRDIPIQSSSDGRIITVADVGDVTLGPAPRFGLADLDGEGDTVGGIVVMRIGENALDVIARVKETLVRLRPSLPDGVEVVTVYDRSDLIKKAIGTLRQVLAEEILIVGLIVSLFLWHARASLVAIIPLPIAVLLSFLPMYFSGLTANIMSLGGIALAIGAMVDSGIILVENAHKKLEGRDTRDLPPGERKRIIIEAMVEMGRPLFFSLLVITVSFLPIFALEGREGRLFQPLAFTKTASMGLAALLAITLTPALAVLFLRGRFLREDQHKVSRFLHGLYSPIIEFVLRFRWLVLGGAVVLMAVTVPVILKIPSEFMPPLNEGSILYMPTSAAGMSLDTAAETLNKQNRIIKSVPEVEHVFGKAGRANSATDPAPVNMFETVITLKDPATWRPGIEYADIVAELNEKLDFLGMPNIWWMPIQTRIEMLSTGIRTAVGIKVFGESVEQVERVAADLAAVVKTIPGARSVFAEKTMAGQFIDLEINRPAAAMFGLSIADIHSTFEAAVGGIRATQIVSGRERSPVVVRYAHDFRDSLEALQDIILRTPSGRDISLSQVASLVVRSGAPMIQSENGRVLGFVFIDIHSEVGIGEFVKNAREAVEQTTTLEKGVSLIWSGQFEAMESARKTLTWVLPLTLLLIVFLLYLNTRSLAEVGIVMLSVPFSLIGAFWLIWLLGYKFSVATWVGILALAGLDAEMGVVMLLYLTNAWRDRCARGEGKTLADLRAAIHEGAVQRVRPKLMTVLSTLVGLLPVMWSLGTGAEVMKRIAAPMVGGIVTSLVLELLVYPVLFYLWKKRETENNVRGASL